MIKYILIAIIFTGSADKVGVRFIDAFDTHTECSVQMSIHNQLTTPEMAESLACIKAEIK